MTEFQDYAIRLRDNDNVAVVKRFLKAGGEMISLPALEEPFARRYPPTDEGPRVAVEGIELPDRVQDLASFPEREIFGLFFLPEDHAR